MRRAWSYCGPLAGSWSPILWTALYDAGAALRAGKPIDWRLSGKSYLWMFPIYGAGGLVFEIAHHALVTWSWPIRGLVYMLGCFAIEYLTGALLQAVTGKVPWDYHHARWNVQGLIRLDYAPVWFALGLVFERIEPIVRVFALAVSR